MATTDLPVRLFGRLVKPYCFAVSLASAVLAYTVIVRGDDVGRVFDESSGPGKFVGFWALLTVTLLWFGWWGQVHAMMRYGLLLAAGLFTARAIWVYLESDVVSTSVLLSACWVLASGGAWLLERRE